MNKIQKKAIKSQKQIQQERETAIASMEFLQRVNFIVSKIRQSEKGLMGMSKEKADGSVAIKRVEFPPDGGVLTHFDKYKYPMKCFPMGETVERVDEGKKVLRAVVDSIIRISRGNKLKSLFFLIFFKKQFEILFQGLIGSFYATIRNCRNKPEMYCISVRETRRVLLLLKKWYGKEKIAGNYNYETWDKLIDFFCMFMEYDDSYRYKYQDVMVELNKDNVEKNPIREIKRLINIIIRKEQEDSMKSKWRMISKFIGFLRFKPYYKKIIKSFLLEINLDRIRMDEADMFHASIKKNYDWPKKEEKKEIPKQND